MSAKSFLVADFQVVRDSPTHCLLGSQSQQKFFRAPVVAGEICQQLLSGEPLDLVAEQYQNRPEPIDVRQFVAQLQTMGLWGDRSSEGTESHKVSPQRSSIGRILFSPIAMALTGMGLVGSIWVLASGALPRVFDSSLLTGSYLGMAATVLLFADLILTTLHEAGHMLAARSYGVSTQLQWGRRLFFPVLQTQMTGLYGIPRSRRWIPILAGMAVDSLILIVVTILLWKGPASWHSVLAWIAIRQILALLWEQMVFLKTDMYYLLTMMTGLYNLDPYARQWFKQKLFRNHPAHILPPYTAFYSMVYVLGSAAVSGYVIYMAITKGRPLTVLALNHIYRAPWALSSCGSWAFILLLIGWISILLWTVMRPFLKGPRGP